MIILVLHTVTHYVSVSVYLLYRRTLRVDLLGYLPCSTHSSPNFSKVRALAYLIYRGTEASTFQTWCNACSRHSSPKARGTSILRLKSTLRVLLYSKYTETLT